MQINSTTPISTFTKMNDIPVPTKQDSNVKSQLLTSQALNEQNGLSNEKREGVVSMVELKQQQALIKTVQNAYQTEPKEIPVADITGEIAREAAKKETKQSLAMTIIERIQQAGSNRPSIQVEA